MVSRKIVFLCFCWVHLAGVSQAEEKILYLTNGDTMEGEIVGETESRISLRLSNGATISIDRNEVESIETQESIDRMSLEIFPGIEEPIPDLDLRDVFQAIDPTPTPIPIKRLGALRIRKKFHAKEYRMTLLPKGTPNEKKQPIRALPMIPEQDEEGNRNYGVITYLEKGPKIRQGEEGWEIAEKDQLLNPGDEIATLEGRVEITTQKGNLLRLDPNTELLIERRRSALKKGKVWVETFSKNSAALDFGNVSLRIQPDGLIYVETLRSGHKVSIVQGKIRINNHPGTPRLLKTLQGPASVWIDGNNVLTSEEDVEPVVLARWDGWEERISESLEEAGGLGSLAKNGSGKQEAEEASEKLKTLLIEIATGLTQFHLDVGHFPQDSSAAFSALVFDPGIPDWNGPYLDNGELPLKDPWGHDLVYRVYTDQGETVAALYSVGPNGEFEEGEEDDMGILIPAPKKQ